MPSRPALTVCLDANVLISAFAYNGAPLELLVRLYDMHFNHVTGPNIIEETRRNLIHKIRLDEKEVDRFLRRILSVSSEVIPIGKIKAIQHHADNKVLEVAIMGGCDVLVTGDKKHLLPLNPFQGMIVEPPSAFLKRLNASKNK